MKTTRIYFKNLDALRFVAAFAVLISHVGQLTELLGYSHFFSSALRPLITGETGVLLFFSLSGFLITYLLLAEEKISGTIGIKNFYIRRALRIWPLYFLTVALALFIWPLIDFLHYKDYNTDFIWSRLPQKLLFYFLLMPGIVMDFLGFVPYASHTWTIGAEELFYFIWPLLLLKAKNNAAAIIWFIIVYLAVYFLLYFYPSPGKIPAALLLICIRYPVSCMAIGGLFAYIAFTDTAPANVIRKIMYTAVCQAVVYTLILVFVIFKVNLACLNNEVYAILLGYLVFNMATNPNRLFNIDNRVMNYLGKISYGLYMFHPLAIAIAVKYCVYMNWTPVFMLYVLAFAATVLLAAVSYHLYEIRFIRKKKAYTQVPSGEPLSQ
ncbi:MAG: acyltransferase [Ferruginibacter sp.]